MTDLGQLLIVWIIKAISAIPAKIVLKFLTLLFGYVIPAWKCSNEVKRNSPTNQLRFWCQYWIVLSFLLILDEMAGALLSSAPVWNYVQVLKLPFLVWLWQPTTHGADQVYPIVERLVNKYMLEHIEAGLQWLRSNARVVIAYFLGNYFPQELRAQLQPYRVAERLRVVDDDLVDNDHIIGHVFHDENFRDDLVHNDYIIGDYVHDNLFDQERRGSAAEAGL